MRDLLVILRAAASILSRGHRVDHLSPRLGKSIGFLSFDEMRRVDAALRIVLDP